jgi:hypothetical protein
MRLKFSKIYHWPSVYGLLENAGAVSKYLSIGLINCCLTIKYFKKVKEGHRRIKIMPVKSDYRLQNIF